MRSIFFIIVLLVNLNASFSKGRELFEKKCSSCHGGYVSMEMLKKNFFEQNNTLLHLEAPTENMLVFAITKGPKSVGVKDDDEMRHIEIEEYLKNHLEEPNTLNSVCEKSFFKYYATKSCDTIILSDEEGENLADFIIEYKPPQQKKLQKQSFNQEKSSSIVSKAIKENKNIIVYATSKTCHFCKDMDKNVLSLKEIKKSIAKDFIFLKVDIDDLKLPYGLEKGYEGMTPTFFFLNSSAQKLSTYPGAWEKKDFLEILDENRVKK